MNKTMYVLSFSLLLCVACSKDKRIQKGKTEVANLSSATVPLKFGICHNGGNEIVISENAVEIHIAHGDAVDRDGDGFYDKENPCSEIDCDDTTYSLDNSCVAIGDRIEGGIVFYVASPHADLDGDGILDRGLVCALSDFPTPLQWGCYNTTIGARTVLGSGQTNTTTIVDNACQKGDGITSAAEVCDGYSVTVGGALYDDWYLPSRDELNLMYRNIGQGNALGLGNIGNFADRVYWSSTEGAGSYGAWVQLFLYGTQRSTGKWATFNVRAVRAF